MNTESNPVLKGAESLFFSGNNIGILLCHGFNGTPQSMEYIGKQLAKYGYTVSIPRLNGHGTHYMDLESCSFHDWISDLKDAYHHLKNQCEKVFIVGQSMGGALTLQVAASSSKVDGIFLINAAVTEVSYMELADEIGEDQYVEEGTPDIKKPFVHEITYEKVPFKAIQQLLLLMENTKKIVHKVKSPTVIFKSLVDHVVPPSNSDYIFKELNLEEKKMVLLENSYHVASMDFDAQLIVENIHEYINMLVTNQSLRLTVSNIND